MDISSTDISLEALTSEIDWVYVVVRCLDLSIDHALGYKGISNRLFTIGCRHLTEYTFI